MMRLTAVDPSSTILIVFYFFNIRFFQISLVLPHPTDLNVSKVEILILNCVSITWETLAFETVSPNSIGTEMLKTAAVAAEAQNNKYDKDNKKSVNKWGNKFRVLH